MKLQLIPSLFLTLIAIPTVSAATTLTSGHADIGIGYHGGFDLHVHDGETDTEYAPNEVVLGVGSQSLQLSPGGAFGFLGPVGTPVWVLPKEENPNLLFLGLGTEELDPVDWTGNIGLTLTAVSGPGNVYLWDVNSFGVPTVSMNSADGITAGDTVALVPGSHAHYNLGFSAQGTYSVSFEATGLHVADGLQNSGPVAYTFQVVPEPGSVVLAIVGAGAVLWFSRRRS